VGVAFTDSEGLVTAWNASAARVLGRTEEEALGHAFPSPVPNQAERFEAALARARGGVPSNELELELQGPEGAARQVTLSFVPLPGSGVAILARDVGARKAAERLRTEELHRLEVVVEAVPVPIFFKDAAGVYCGCNRAFEEYLGLPRERIVGLPVEGLSPPELARVYRRADDELFARGGTQCYETQVRWADGSVRDVIFRKAVFASEAGGVGGLVGSILDITDRKRAEAALRESEARLALADRLSSIGTLAAGVAHEINNPLAYVLANLEYARRALGGSERVEVEQALADALEGASRVSRIVQDLKGFARADEAAVEVDLTRVLRSTANLARAEVRRRGALVVELPAELPPITGNASRLGQVFLNLLVNAAQALPDGAPDRHQVRLRAHAERHRVVVEVEDTGSGIDPEIRGRLFDPFFTTKPVGIGTGLGLAISHQIVTDLGGEIEVTSAPGQGATFRVSLPLAAGRTAGS
jgi:PAS domain S-box-containing protein